MKVLILGYSSIARRRVIPALMHVDGVSGVQIGSRSVIDLNKLEATIDATFVGYDLALANSDAEAVYISTVNSLHEQLVEKALASGRHVMVDKPAFLELETAQRMVSIAAAKSLCLVEMTVFSYHPQFDSVRNLIARDGPVERAVAIFSMPPFPADSYRYNMDLGGGALNDLSPYAAATGRLFFSGAPHEATCRVLTRHQSGADLSFSVLANYGNGRSLMGTFGFDTEYRNSILALGPNLSLSLERAFSPPPDFKNRIKVRRANQPKTVFTTSGDSFVIAIQDFIDAIKSGDFTRFTKKLLIDAQARHTISQSAVGV
jgi:predicted dehydrogenase